MIATSHLDFSSKKPGMDDEFIARLAALSLPMGSSTSSKEIPSDSDLETRLAKLTGLTTPDKVKKSTKYSIPPADPELLDQFDSDPDLLNDISSIAYEDAHISVPNTLLPTVTTPRKKQYINFTDHILASPTSKEVGEADFLLQQIAQALKLEERYVTHEPPSSGEPASLESRLKNIVDSPIQKSTSKSKHHTTSNSNVLGEPPAPISLQDVEEWCCKFSLYSNCRYL
jgi:hypothetical protein